MVGNKVGWPKAMWDTGLENLQEYSKLILRRFFQPHYYEFPLILWVREEETGAGMPCMFLGVNSVKEHSMGMANRFPIRYYLQSNW